MDRNEELRKCRNFLADHDVGVISTASNEGHPHASVVNYFSNDKFEIFFIAREKAQKYRNIKSNPLVCLVVCDQDFVQSLELKGDAYELEDNEDTMNKLRKLSDVVRRKNPGPLPIMRHPGSELHLFCMKVGYMTYADFSPTHDSRSDYFELDL